MACADPFGTHETPFTDIRALFLDHVGGDGAVKRRQSQAWGRSYNAWLIRNGFPDRLQVLCANCNEIKKRENQEYGRPIT